MPGKWEECKSPVEAEGIDFEIFQIGAKSVQDCIGCGKCSEGGCIYCKS